jgi:hypothetical protein
MDTTSGILTRNDVTKIDWRDGILYTSTGVTSIDWENRTLYDSAAGASTDWTGRFLFDSTSATSIDWENRLITTPGGYNALDYSNEIYLNSNLYYRNEVGTAIQDVVADNAYYAGQIIEGVIDGAVSNFDLVYLDTDGTWYPTKNDIAQRATKMQGICVSTGKSLVLIEGDVGVSDDNSQGAYVVSANYGLPVYMSSTTGEMTTTQPASGFIRIVGHIYYQSPNDVNLWIMKFRPSNDWYVI